MATTDGLARSRRPEICKKFEASDRLRLNVLGVSNGKETPQMDQILTFVDFLRDHHHCDERGRDRTGGDTSTTV